MKKALSCFIRVVSFLVLIFSASAQGEVREIRILHVNDFHGFAMPHRPFGSQEPAGGIAYLAALAEALRNEKPSLLLSAGDMIQGSDWANLFQGKSVVEVMNRMRFDGMVVGNHEFDFGQKVLRQRIGEARFPVLGANVEGFEVLKPYTIQDLAGIRIGIIGVVTEDTPVTTHPSNVVGLRFLAAEETVRRYVESLRNRVEVVVVLSHLGLYADRLLAERVKGIDVIVGGHSHTKVERPLRIGETVLVQAWEHGKALGVLDLALEGRKIVSARGHLEIISPALGKTDESVEALVLSYQKKVDELLEEVVGEAENDLDGENVRKRETNLGNLIADILRERAGAQVALINGGGIRRSILKGPIRLRDVYGALPFDNYIVAVRLTGTQLRETLEHGVSRIEEEAGRFPQVSGLTFTFNPSEPPGRRVKEILVSGRPIVLDQEYVVATHDFLAAGGDGYRAFGEAVKSSKDFALIGGAMKGEKLVYSNPGQWLRDVVIEFIRSRGKVSPLLEGRIREGK